jgi:stage II sporulation protein M
MWFANRPPEPVIPRLRHGKILGMAEDTATISGTMPSRGIKPYLLIQSGLFLAGFLIGFFLPVPWTIEMLGELVEKFGPHNKLSPTWLFLFILANNATKAFFILLLGIMFGILPVVSVFLNGYVLGIVCLWAVGKAGIASAMKAVIPHGVLEIPTLIISTAYGLWLGVVFARRISQRDWKGAGGQVRHAVTIYFKVAFPLFILAALIETFLIISMGGVSR